jgi:hypothetical protein
MSDDYQRWRENEARKAADEAREREERQLELPMTGPSFSNPIIWRRRLATPRGQGAVLVVIALFLLLMSWHDLTTDGSYSLNGLVVGGVGLPLGLWSLATGVSPTTSNKPGWWWGVAIPLAVAGALVALRWVDLF